MINWILIMQQIEEINYMSDQYNTLVFSGANPRHIVLTRTISKIEAVTKIEYVKLYF